MWLKFTMKLDASDKLLLGELSVRDGNNKSSSAYTATSGLPKNQKPDSQDDKGRGPIPECKLVKIQSYSVCTNPIDHKNTPGIKGNFYHIIPDPIRVNQTQRTELGIHFDAGVPGSAGCIVLKDTAQWISFQDFMADYSKDFSHISLIVEYA